MKRQSIGFGLVPTNPDDTIAAFELAECLSEGLPWRLEAEVFESPLAMTLAFGSGKLDLVWSSPALALTSPALREATAVASSIRQGRAHYHAILFVKRHSAVQSPVQLAGLTAAWVAESSASGHIFPKVALAGHGIDPQTTFGSELFVGSHGKVVEAVAQGTADVGATYANFNNGDATQGLVNSGISDSANPEEFRILLATPAVPSDLLLLRNDLCASFGEHVRHAFNEAGRDRQETLTRVLGTATFAEVDHDGLSELRQQLDAARALGVPLAAAS